MLSVVCGFSVFVGNVLCDQSCFDVWFRLITLCVISRASISDSAAGAGAAGAAAGAGIGGGAAGFA